MHFVYHVVSFQERYHRLSYTQTFFFVCRAHATQLNSSVFDHFDGSSNARLIYLNICLKNHKI